LFKITDEEKIFSITLHKISFLLYVIYLKKKNVYMKKKPEPLKFYAGLVNVSKKIEYPRKISISHLHKNLIFFMTKNYNEEYILHI